MFKLFWTPCSEVCNRDRVTWIEYVNDLMIDRPDIPIGMYGKWASYVNDMRVKQGIAGLPDLPVVQAPVQEPAIKDLGNAPRMQTKPEVLTSKIPTKPIVGEVALKLNEPHKSGTIDKVDATKDQEMDVMLSKLRGQGLNVSSTTLYRPQVSSDVPVFAVKSKVKLVCESGRGRGRRKASLN